MTSPATLHFFCGKAGAGKTTLARDIAASLQATMLSEDIWLARLFGAQMQTFDDYLAFAARLRSLIAPVVVDLLACGRSVVLDFPANTVATREWFRQIIDTSGCDHVLHFLETEDRECLRRIGQRNADRPEGSHHLSEADFLHISSFFQPPAAGDGFNVRRHRPGTSTGSSGSPTTPNPPPLPDSKLS